MGKQPYFKHKLRLFFDENFPIEAIEEFKKERQWKRKCKVTSTQEQELGGRGDDYIFNFCKKHQYTLVTLDAGFMNDRKYPFGRMPGIIRIVAKKSETEKIRDIIADLIYFLSLVYLPRIFVGDTKIQASDNFCIFRGKDMNSGEIKTIKWGPNDSFIEVLKKFSYMPFV